jgi:hypothetical protein
MEQDKSTKKKVIDFSKPLPKTTKLKGFVRDRISRIPEWENLTKEQKEYLRQKMREGLTQ